MTVEVRPWRQAPIGDYGFLSDCASAVLVDWDGSIDWWCVPRFDSPSVWVGGTVVGWLA